MHSPRRLIVILGVVAAVSLWTACSRKSSTPTSPHVDDPVCAVSPESLDFGSVRVGYGADLTFSIANSGGGTLAGTLSDTSAAFRLIGSDSYSLTAGQAATFTVRFAPLREGAQSCAVETGSSACGAVTCLGTTPAEPDCRLQRVSPSSNFGDVEIYSSADLQFSITNAGGGTLAGTVSCEKPDFAIVGTSSYSLTANQSATFTVRFTPTISGSQVCVVRPGCSACDSLLVAGTGVLPSGTRLADLDFGSVAVGSSSERTFTVYSACGSTLPYAVCTTTPSETPFRVVGAYPGSPSYRCDTGYLLPLPYTYTAMFIPQQTGTQRCVIKLLCESTQYAGYRTFGYVTCTGVGY